MIRPADREYCQGLRKMLARELRWVELEPSAEPLWARIRATVSRCLTHEWQQGLIEGATPDEAVYVRCGRETMTAEDVDNGRVVVDIGIGFGMPRTTFTMQLVLQARRAFPAPADGLIH